ncbi:MAG: hypothetical protein R8M14_02210 [Ghiorsea sp.]
MKISKAILAMLFLGSLTLNSCMLGHLFTDDESGMVMHEGMSMESMPMHQMMHSNDE